MHTCTHADCSQCRMPGLLHHGHPAPARCVVTVAPSALPLISNTCRCEARYTLQWIPKSLNMDEGCFYSGFPSFFGFALEDGHVSNFWLLLWHEGASSHLQFLTWSAWRLSALESPTSLNMWLEQGSGAPILPKSLESTPRRKYPKAYNTPHTGIELCHSVRR